MDTRSVHSETKTQASAMGQNTIQGQRMDEEEKRKRKGKGSKHPVLRGFGASVSSYLSDFNSQVKDIQKTTLVYTNALSQVGQVETLEQGVSTTFRATLGPILKMSLRAFLQNCQIIFARKCVTSAEMAARLPQWSEEVTGEQFVLPQGWNSSQQTARACEKSTMNRIVT